MKISDRKVQYATALSVSIASFTVGAISAWPSPVIPKFRNNETSVDIVEGQISWVIGMSRLGFMVGSLATRFLADMCGRRPALLVSALPLGLGTTIAVFALKAWLLQVMMFLWGFGTGIVGTVVPMYLAEISDKDIRGSLSLSTRVMFSLGHLLVMSVGSFLTYRLLNLLLLGLAPACLAACWWVPESPQYSLKSGRVRAAMRDLRRLKGYKDEQALEEELRSLQSHVKSDMQRSSSYIELFTGKQYRKALLISAGLKVAQIMSGSQTISQYLGSIMQESRSALTLHTVLIVFGAVRFVVGFLSTVLVDRLGRRPLLSYSFLGNALSLAIVGLYFFLQKVILVEENKLRLFGVVPFAAIIASNIISTLGFASVVFFIPAEIFPMNVKVVALTALNIFGGIIGFLESICYQKIKDLTGLYGSFWYYTAISVFGAVFVFFYLPETRGRSLDEIQVLMQGGADDKAIVEGGLEKVELKAIEYSVLNDDVGNGAEVKTFCETEKK